MFILPDYHKSTEVLHFGCEAPRAYFVPAETKEKAASLNRAGSAYFKSLLPRYPIASSADAESSSPREKRRTA